jgi:ACS family allantoate permease-like MFS transporter
MASSEKTDIEEIAPDTEPQPQTRDVEELKVLSNPSQASVGLGKIDDIIIDTVNAETEYTPEQFRKLRWKIDLWLLPLMWVCIRPEKIPEIRCIAGILLSSRSSQVCYGTQQADKTSVSVQAVFGIRTNTHLVGQQFSC